MKPTLFALLTLLPSLAHAESVCQVRAEDRSFTFFQDGARISKFRTVEEALGTLDNMVEKGVCRRSAAPSFCELSIWGNDVYVDQITSENRSPALATHDAAAAADYLAKLEKLGLCKIAENKESCSLRLSPDGGDHPFEVVQNEENSSHGTAHFDTAVDAIRFREALVRGKGCRIVPQALECTIDAHHGLILDKYILKMGDQRLNFRHSDQADASRDALIAAKACVTPRPRDAAEAPAVAPDASGVPAPKAAPNEWNTAM